MSSYICRRARLELARMLLFSLFLAAAAVSAAGALTQASLEATAASGGDSETTTSWSTAGRSHRSLLQTPSTKPVNPPPPPVRSPPTPRTPPRPSPPTRSPPRPSRPPPPTRSPPRPAGSPPPPRPPPSPPAPPPTIRFDVGVEFGFQKAGAPPPDRVFGRDVNCTGLALLMARNLTDAATLAGAQIAQPFRPATSCNSTQFILSSAIVWDSAACTAFDRLISSPMMYGWSAYAMLRNRNCSAYPNLQVRVVAVAQGAVAGRLAPCVVKYLTVDYCYSRPLAPALPSTPPPPRPRTPPPSPSPWKAPRPRPSPLPRPTSPPPSRSPSPTPSPSQQPEALAFDIMVGFRFNRQQGGPALPPPDRLFGRDVNCTALEQLISANVTAAAAAARAQLPDPLKVTACNGTTEFRMSGSVTWDETACTALSGLVTQRMMGEWLRFTVREKLRCAAYPNLLVYAAVLAEGFVGGVSVSCVVRFDEVGQFCAGRPMGPALPPSPPA